MRFPLFLFTAFATGCATTPAVLTVAPDSKATAELYEFPQTPELTKGIRLGGFSGLSFEGRNDRTGLWNFLTHTDRGPNLEPVTDSKLGEVRPFPLPQFHPEWVRFTFGPKEGLKIVSRVELTNSDGKPVTGLPNLPAGKWGDEVPVDLQHHKIKLDPRGLDLESIARDSDGTYWMGEEYRPSVLHFSKEGRLLSRWVPAGNDKKLGAPLLPAHYRERQKNRGFEGLAVAGPFVFAFLQSGLNKQDDFTHILKIDKSTGRPLAEYLYRFEPKSETYKRVDKLGDAAALDDHRFLVIEQNGETGDRALRRIYEIDLSKATNVLARAGKIIDESQIVFVEKKLVADLVELGFRKADKAEGLALIDAHTLAVVNDNDFGVGESGATTPNYFLVIHLP